jgi:hypothetical protein
MVVTLVRCLWFNEATIYIHREVDLFLSSSGIVAESVKLLIIMQSSIDSLNYQQHKRKLCKLNPAFVTKFYRNRRKWIETKEERNFLISILAKADIVNVVVFVIVGLLSCIN